MWERWAVQQLFGLFVQAGCGMDLLYILCSPEMRHCGRHLHP